MAFRASNLLPQKGYDEARQIAGNIKRVVDENIAGIASGTTSSVILDTLWFFVKNSNRLVTLSTIPGIADYAIEQENDPAYDVAVEFAALLAVIDDAEAWIRAALPVDGDDYLLINTLGETALVPRAFTSQQVAGLIVKLQAISDQII
jgi:hypothetical protein